LVALWVEQLVGEKEWMRGRRLAVLLVAWLAPLRVWMMVEKMVEKMEVRLVEHSVVEMDETMGMMMVD